MSTDRLQGKSTVTIAIDQLLTPEILQPARYLGNELGAIHKPWDTATVRWVLTYPEVYEVGASNLGHIILYNILNAQPRQLCDRTYLPAADFSAKLRATQTPLFALETRRPLTDFDILGFSLGYELGGSNILEMLSLAGIPLTWSERQQSETPWNAANGSYPLIFAGGQTATSNPEPFADFFDFMALGDGEELLPEIGLVIAEGKAAGLSREAILLDLAQVPGVYVPRFYAMTPEGSVHPNRPDVPERILRRVAAPIPAYAIGPVPYVETVHDRLTVEIRRGCTRGCRFCQPGMLTRPARDVDPETIVQTVETGMRATGYSEFSLLSLSCSDYLALPAVGLDIKNRLQGHNITLSLPSQRVDRFDENIAHILGGNRLPSLTFAPEAGTQRMRDIVNKGLTNEELLRGVKTAYEQGWDKVKLYFMIGLPGETDADVMGIVETIRWLQTECFIPGRKRLAINVTISNFTPKPHTPFQWHSVATAEFARKREFLFQEFRATRGVKANFTDVRISAMEDFIGRGDRRLSAVVRRAWELGAGMDAWMENAERAYEAWTGAIADVGLTWKYRQVESGEWNVMGNGNGVDLETKLNAPLPWDHIDTGIDKNWLKADLKRALEAATVPDCSFDGCSHCGVCGTDFGHNVVVPPPPIPIFAGEVQPNTTKAQRLRVWFGKEGDMVRVSHLDLIRLFDRAVRRADLPVSYTGGFHPSPRISPANALSLGTSSSGEVLDVELTTLLDPDEFKTRFAAQLPAGIPIYRVEAIALNEPSITQQLDRAEYRLALTPLVQEESTPALPAVGLTQWQTWVDQVLAQDDFTIEKITKSGKKQWVNLRDRLFDLELLEIETEIPGITTPSRAILRYVGSCRNDGTLLKPEHILFMVEQVSGQNFQLSHVHRQQLLWPDLTPANVDTKVETSPQTSPQTYS